MTPSFLHKNIFMLNGIKRLTTGLRNLTIKAFYSSDVVITRYSHICR